MKLAIGFLGMFVMFTQFSVAQTQNNSALTSPLENAAVDGGGRSFAVFGATPSQETALRSQIRLMHPEVPPLRVFFVPHWKYLENARIFKLHVPTGYASLMFTHLPSRTVFIDNDHYTGEDWLEHWIAHELGHLAKNSPKEEEAEKAALEFRRRLRNPRSRLPVPAANAQSDLIQLRVSVFNSSPILPSTVERAESEAGHVLRDAGVAVIWLNCPQDAQHEASLGPCSKASFPSHLHLRIVRASRGLKATTVGISFVAEDGKGCYADLFYEPIQQLQEENHVSTSVILGHAMAHELGHLLLGTNSHSSSGLMRAHWTGEDLAKASKGSLWFSQEQSLRITSRLAQTASPDLQPSVRVGN